MAAAPSKRTSLENLTENRGTVNSLLASHRIDFASRGSIALKTHQTSSVYIDLVSDFSEGGGEGLGRPDTQVTVHTIVFATLQCSPPPPPLHPEMPNTRRKLPMWNKLIHSEECFQNDFFRWSKTPFYYSKNP